MRRNPVSDGDVCYGCDYFVDRSYVLVSSGTQGVVKFPGEVPNPGIDRAWLSLNLIWLPPSESSVRIYGLGSSTAQLALSELGAGSLLGTVRIPADNWSDVFLDVTDFVRGTPAAYLAFTLQSANGQAMAFSSLELNQGNPVQLILTQVPEPAHGALMFAGLLTLAGWLRRRASA